MNLYHAKALLPFVMEAHMRLMVLPSFRDTPPDAIALLAFDHVDAAYKALMAQVDAPAVTVPGEVIP